MVDISLLAKSQEEQKLLNSFWDASETDLKTAVEVIKEWHKKQACFPKQIDENFFRRVLIKNRINIERAKNQIENYYLARTLYPQYFNRRDIRSQIVQKYIKASFCTPLSNLTDKLCRIVYISFAEENSALVDPVIFFNNLIALFELLLHYDESEGEYMVIDCRNLSSEFSINFTQTILKTFVSILVNAYTDKLLGVYFYNIPLAAEEPINNFRDIISKKGSTKVMIICELEELYSYIPKQYLPADLEGDLKPSAEIFDEWMKFYECLNDWLIEQANLKIDESLLHQGTSGRDFVGTNHGTLIKLSIDLK